MLFRSDVSKVTTMQGMFRMTTIPDGIEDWDVSNLKDMHGIS